MHQRHKRARHALNETFFDTIDTEPKAYWLGFLYADGCVAMTGRHPYKVPGVVQLKLAAKDLSHVEAFRTAIGYGGPVQHRDRADRKLPNGKMLGAHSDCSLFVSSRYMSHALVRLGCTPRKSLTLQWPTADQVPPHLLHHFVRGYFDGDGCISAPRLEAGRRPQYTMQILGTEAFLTGMRAYLATHGAPITKLYLKPGQKAFYLTYGGSKRVTAMREVLYRDATVWLTRKRERFDACAAMPGGQRGLPPCVVSQPNGIEVTVTDYRAFARERGIHPSSLWHVLVGDKRVIYGYRLVRFCNDANGQPYQIPPRRNGRFVEVA